jgi:hypothetical protein
VSLLKDREYAGSTGSTGPTGPARAVDDVNEGEYTFQVTGSTGPTGPIETIQVTNKDIEEQLNPLLVAFENTKSEHYRVQRAKVSVIIAGSAGAKGRLSLGFLDLGGEGKYEKTRGLEIEIERIKDRETASSK